jgi:2-hydroxychromene-2-carboxylate isomerase
MSGTHQIEFYFDFSSPYGYLASEKIDDLAAGYGRKVRWRPILLGVVFKQTGGAPLTTLPLKGEYSLHDFSRSARFMGVPYTHPQAFPLATQHAARTFYWLARAGRRDGAGFRPRVFRALYRDGRNVSELDVVLELAARHGIDRARLAGSAPEPGAQGSTQSRKRRGARSRRLWFAVHHRRRRTVLWRRSPAPDRTLAGQRRFLMPVLQTQLNPAAPTSRPTPRQCAAVVADLRATVDRIALGGPEAARQKHLARGKLLPRERVNALIDPGSAFLELSQLAAYGMYGEATSLRGAGGVADHRHRPGERRRVHDRRQRCDGERRHLLPADGQEAPAGAGDRRREPPAVHLSGRFGRRLPADAGRGLSRQGAFRTHLLQPGQSVGGRHSADRRRDGFLHRRRRLRAGDVRRVDHRQGPGNDLSRRAAAGQGGDRRSGQRRGPRRRRRAYADFRRRRSLRGKRRACAGDRSPHRRQSQLAQASAVSSLAEPHASRSTRRRALRGDPERRQEALRRARDHRPYRRWIGFRRVQGALRDDHRLRFRAPLGLPDRHCRQQRHPVSRNPR